MVALWTQSSTARAGSSHQHLSCQQLPVRSGRCKQHRCKLQPQAGHPIPSHGCPSLSQGHEQSRQPQCPRTAHNPGVRNPGGRQHCPRSRLMETPLPSEKTAAIFGPSSSCFKCQQIYISEIHPLLLQHTRSILGS